MLGVGGCGGGGTGLLSQARQVLSPDPVLLSRRAVLSKLSELSEPQFLHLKKINKVYLAELS